MKRDAQYYEEKAEECLARAEEIHPTFAKSPLEIAEKDALIAEAQVYATLALAAQQKPR